MRNRALFAEFVGTLILVFVGVGAAVFGTEIDVGTVGIGLAFGFTLAALVYALGHVSGCHLNPAVTLAMLIGRRLPVVEAAGYWVAQVAGAFVASLLLFLTVHLGPDVETSEAFGTNGYGDRSAVGLNVGGALIAEIILTFVLVYVILSVAAADATPAVAGLAIGAALTALHMVGVALTGLSVNPARSIGPALFAGGDALVQLWVFILAPLAGGALAAVTYAALGAAPRAARQDWAGT